MLAPSPVSVAVLVSQGVTQLWMGAEPTATTQQLLPSLWSRCGVWSRQLCAASHLCWAPPTRSLQALSVLLCLCSRFNALIESSLEEELNRVRGGMLVMPDLLFGVIFLGAHPFVGMHPG